MVAEVGFDFAAPFSYVEPRSELVGAWESGASTFAAAEALGPETLSLAEAVADALGVEPGGSHFAELLAESLAPAEARDERTAAQEARLEAASLAEVGASRYATAAARAEALAVSEARFDGGAGADQRTEALGVVEGGADSAVYVPTVPTITSPASGIIVEGYVIDFAGTCSAGQAGDEIELERDGVVVATTVVGAATTWSIPGVAI